MLILVWLWACDGGADHDGDFAVDRDPPTGVFADHPDLLSTALAARLNDVLTCHGALVAAGGPDNTSVRFGLTAQGGQRATEGTIYVRSAAFDACIREVRDSLSIELETVLGPLANQAAVAKSESKCTVTLGEG